MWSGWSTPEVDRDHTDTESSISPSSSRRSSIIGHRSCLHHDDPRPSLVRAGLQKAGLHIHTTVRYSSPREVLYEPFFRETTVGNRNRCIKSLYWKSLVAVTIIVVCCIKSLYKYRWFKKPLYSNRWSCILKYRCMYSLYKNPCMYKYRWFKPLYVRIRVPIGSCIQGIGIGTLVRRPLQQVAQLQKLVGVNYIVGVAAENKGHVLSLLTMICQPLLTMNRNLFCRC